MQTGFCCCDTTFFSSLFCEVGKLRERVGALRHCVLWHNITAVPHQHRRSARVCTGVSLGEWSAPSLHSPHPLPPLALSARGHLHACAKLSQPLLHLSLSSHIHYRAGLIAFACRPKEGQKEREGERERCRRVKQGEAEGAYDTKEREREREIGALEIGKGRGRLQISMVLTMER